LLNFVFGAHDTHFGDAISLALYVTTNSLCMRGPKWLASVHPRSFLVVPLDLLRLVERGNSTLHCGISDLGRSHDEGWSPEGANPLRCISTPESQARRFTLGLEL